MAITHHDMIAGSNWSPNDTGTAVPYELPFGWRDALNSLADKGRAAEARAERMYAVSVEYRNGAWRPREE